MKSSEQSSTSFVFNQMKTLLRKVIYLFIVFILIPVLSFAQFGKNKVQYKNFTWYYIQTEHFDIYFYDGGEEVAQYAADIAEFAYKKISTVMNWRLKKRVSVITYLSHNDFQQTNVTYDYLPEGVGGFTELFKNRIVVPFEGSIEQFRHVVYHEMVHAVINDMIYGGSVQSIISGAVTLNIPLWMNEGLAEYFSLYWDTQTDMIIRDIAINSNIPTTEQLNNFLAYKGGQSVYRFIGEKYGDEKIGEVWAMMKSRRNVEKGLKASLGMDFKELTEDWQKYIRLQYWPDIENRSSIEDIASSLTDHEKLQNYFNISPAISPKGGKIAILSDRSGYADIYLISILDGVVIKKVLSGQRSPDFEELKWLQPGISWSPDGENIVFSAKAGSQDALFILNVETEKKQKYTFDLDGIFTPVWSPISDSIVFCGLKNGQTDLYLYDLGTKKLSQLTNDFFSESEPAWSPDEKRIAFVSDRASILANARNLRELDLDDFSIRQTDIFTIDVASGEITRITRTPYNENYPEWANTRDILAFTSDRSGIWNIYLHDFDSDSEYPITNVLTGIFQISWSRDDSQLAFSGYSDMGWDVYLMNNPLKFKEGDIVVNDTKYRKFTKSGNRQVVKRPSPEEMKETYSTGARSNDFSNYIFLPSYERKYNIYDTTAVVTLPDTVSNVNPDGTYAKNRYKTRFTIDFIDSQAGYSTFWGFQGTTLFAFSDILGNHQIYLGTELFVDLKNSDYFLVYQYLPGRINYSFTGFHSANLFSSGFVYYYRLQNYGVDLSISRPFSKFTRLDFATTFYNVKMDLIDTYYQTEQTLEQINTVLPRVALVFDNSLWGYLNPVDGWRANLTFLTSPRYSKTSLVFSTLTTDIRRYFKINWDYSFTLRLTGGLSWGRDPQRFFLGGVSNWVNYKIRTTEERTGHNLTNLQEIYFSDFITPLRGAKYYEGEGDHFILTNYEFHFPFIKYLATGMPPLTFFNIRGLFFLDMGAAWWYDDQGVARSNDYDSDKGEYEKFRLIGWNQYQGLFMDDLISGFGFGTRWNFGYFLLRVDVAWRFDFDRVWKPAYYFSLGLDL